MRRNILLISLVLCTVLIVSCEQTEDRLTPVSSTDLYLHPSRLPDLPEGMAYELWVAKNENLIQGTGVQYTSLGQFSHDHAKQRFTRLDMRDSARADSNHLFLEGDIFSYDSIFVSVEIYPDTGSGNGPGPIMLADAISDPADDPIELFFPFSESLFVSTCEFNMEATSDEDDQLGLNGLKSSTDGAAIWFSRHSEIDGSITDTLHLDRFTIKFDTVNLTGDTILRPVIDIIKIWNGQEIKREFGLDTFIQLGTTFEVVRDSISAPPWIQTTLELFYTIDTMPTEFTFDRFIQPGYEWVDQTGTGWIYRGWVVSPIISDLGIAQGQFRKPSWRDVQVSLDFTGTEGGLLSTGTFQDISIPDAGNPYIDTTGGRRRVPPIAGEDFLRVPDSAGVLQTVQLVPGGGSQGTVFITLEPENWIYDGQSNFPLFVMVRRLPGSRAEVTARDQTFVMKNRTGNTDPSVGFPKLDIDIRRF